MNELAVTYGLVLLTNLSLIVLGAAIGLWFLKRTSPFFRSLATAAGLTGIIGACGGLTFLDSGHGSFWQLLVVLGQLFLPAAMLYLCVSLIDPSKLELIRPARWRARVMAAIGGALAFIRMVQEFAGLVDAGGVSAEEYHFPTIHLVMASFLIVGFVFDLAYIEQSLRLLRDPLRYQLKYMLIGVGVVAGVQIYHASQSLSVSVEGSSAVLLSGFGALLAMGLIGVGLVRSRLHDTQASLYIRPGIVYGSVTFVVVGLYLIVVGLVGELIRYSGLPLREVLSGLVILVAVIVLLVVAASRSVRATANRWMAQLVYQAKYDYRAKWLEVTNAFHDCHTTDAVLDRFLDLLSRTFGAPRISVWMGFESDSRFHMVRSTVLEAGEASLPSDHPVVTQLLSHDEVLNVEDMVFADTVDDHRFRSFTRVKVCVSIQSAGQLLGFIAVGRDERGERYRADDCQLLRVMAHHFGMVLALSQQTEERRASVELEALHRFSAFCLHDLKNLTAGLSLVVQNAIVHGQDPAFQQSVMKTVVGTVRKMTALMEKLSLKTSRAVSWQTVDLTAIIRDAATGVKVQVCMDLSRLDGQSSLVHAVPEELHQVFTNVLLNACQAAGECSTVSIQVEGDGRMVRVQVTDHGPGIPHDRLRTLFQPFQTTKVGGLGIGLYQCKRIVESHQGTIHILSRVGEGTTIRVTLPVVDGALMVPNARVEEERTAGVEGESQQRRSSVGEQHEEMHHAG